MNRLAKRKPSPLKFLLSTSGLHLTANLMLGVCLVHLATSHASAGRVAIVGDDWPLSDFAFDLQPEQANPLAETIASFFSPGGSGNFLVVSETTPVIPFGPRGVNGPELAAAMQSLGHTWTIDPAVDFTLANLLPYDAVFLSGHLGSGASNATELHHYVQAGGGVFIMGGTRDFGAAADEAQAWDPFLSEFGLSLGTAWLGETTGTITSVPAIAGGTPPGQGVTQVAWSVGQLATAGETLDPKTRVALKGDFTTLGGGPQGAINDILAVYEAPFLAGDFNDDGLVDSADYPIWREALGQSVFLPGDPTPGVVDSTDFQVWVNQYGAGAAGGSLADSSVTNGGSPVPEPVAAGLLIAWLLAGQLRRRACCTRWLTS